MYTDHQESEFSAFLKENIAFWREHTGCPCDPERRIYVDLCHDNPAYLLTNLWIAKYLQKIKRGRVIGLASGWLKPCPHYAFEKVKKLADSFLVDEVVDLDRLDDDSGPMTVSFVRKVEGLTGASLRQAVLSFEEKAEPNLGWILYDTWLRQERCGTFETVDPGLISCATMVFKARHSVAAAMRGGKAVAAIVGHYHYSPYAWIALEAVRQNAPVFFQSLLLPVSIRRFATEADFRRGRPANFLPAYEALVAQKVRPETLDSFKRRMYDIQRGVRQFFRPIANADRIQSRYMVLRDLDLDPQKPIVCLFVPALSGPAHCFGPLMFDDNGDWLKKSLDIAVETPSINFLVKSHPQNAVYDSNDFVGRCEAEYGHRPNIHFLKPDLSLNQVAALCDVAVTVSGTPGYEMGTRGVPCIAAGPNRYSDLGFAIEPATYAEYKSYLQRPEVIKIDATQWKNAVLFMYFETAAGRSQAIFIPDVRSCGTPVFWRDAEGNLRSKFPEEDALFRNLRLMVERDLPFLLNSDLVPIEMTSDRTDRPSTESLLAGLHAVSLVAVRSLEARLAAAEQDSAKAIASLNAMADFVAAFIDGGQHVRLGRGYSSGPFLVSGWSVPEDGGIWTDGEVATIAFPSLQEEAVLCIQCQAYTPEESPVRRVSVWRDNVKLIEHSFHRTDSKKIFRIPVRVRNGRVEATLKIEQPVVPPGGSRWLGVWVSEFWLEPVNP
jgi:hypothetical protein